MALRSMVRNRIVEWVASTMVALALLPALALDGAGALAASPAGDIHFRWAFCRLIEGNDSVRLEPVKEGTELKAGDKIKMMVEPQKGCYVYVIHQNSQGDISMLFPYSPDQFKTDYKQIEKYYIPAGQAWFQLDEHPGAETFFLLASDQRLADIEYLFDRYKSADPAGKPKMAAMVIAAIRDIQAQPQSFVASAESSSPQGRAVRGFERAESYGPSDIAGFADKISATGLYSKTITIEHR